MFEKLPSGCQNIDTIQTFGTIHLGKHLIDHSIGDPRTIMASVDDKSKEVSMLYTPFPVVTFLEQSSRIHQRIEHMVSRQMLVQTDRGRIFHLHRCTCSGFQGP
jgi:hypothetical protein